MFFTDQHSEASHSPVRDGSRVVNGVTLPEHVLEELRLLGVSPDWYNPMELKWAVDACHHDRNLVDDHKGDHFFDKLHRTAEEEAEEQEHAGSFVGKLMKQREAHMASQHVTAA